MYTLFFHFIGLFLKRRCRVTLTNGTTIVWLRPKGTDVAGYRAQFDQWRAAAVQRIKLDSGQVIATISSSNIVSVEIR